MLLSDMGSTTYLQRMHERPEETATLCDDASRALVRLQGISRQPWIPVYDARACGWKSACSASGTCRAFSAWRSRLRRRPGAIGLRPSGAQRPGRAADHGAPRLPQPQPHGGHTQPGYPGLPGRGLGRCQLRPGLSAALCLHRMGRNLPTGAGPAPLGTRSAGACAHARALQRFLARLRMGRSAQATQGARVLRAPERARQPVRVPPRHAPRVGPRLAHRPPLPRARRPGPSAGPHRPPRTRPSSTRRAPTEPHEPEPEPHRDDVPDRPSPTPSRPAAPRRCCPCRTAARTFHRRWPAA